MPPLVSPLGWECVEAFVAALESLQSCACVLNANPNAARAAQIVPVVWEFRSDLRRRCELCKQEGVSQAVQELNTSMLLVFDERMQKTLCEPWQIRPALYDLHRFSDICSLSGIDDYWQFCAVAAFCAGGLGLRKLIMPGFSHPGEGSAESVIRSIRKQFTRFCICCGIRSFLGIHTPGQVHESGGSVKNLRARVESQVTEFCRSANQPGVADPSYLCHWWHKEGKACYPELIPGVRVLLRVPAGSGHTFDKLFHHCRELVAPHDEHEDATDEDGTDIASMDDSSLGLRQF